MMTFSQFLAMIAGGTGSSAILSWISERVPAFQNLSPTVKWWVQLIGTIGLSVTAFAVSTYIPEEILDNLAPWFAVVAGAWASFQANQVAHKADKY
jgi:hypothetical protein